MNYKSIFSIKKSLAIVALVLSHCSIMPMERAVEEGFLNKAKQVIAKNSGSFALGTVAGAAVTAGITYYRMRNQPIVIQHVVVQNVHMPKAPEPIVVPQVVPEVIEQRNAPEVPEPITLFKYLHGTYKGQSLYPCREEKYEFSPYSFDAIEIKNCFNGDTKIYESERDGMIKVELYKGSVVHGRPWQGSEQCIEDFDRVLSIKSLIENEILQGYNCMAVHIDLPKDVKDNLQILVSDNKGLLYKKYKK